ncbi:HAMP domain-containing sensor histidine kinase [Actinoplanes sp. M2I2]|uniref:sensor histidine kinase n=1 Tax=Actinoplanes sp. M2I2 TaxID=1734444 RepID=UPI0020200D1E|nr:HAMP domain-containing sensor histidine kinase [Actinoplanes sp. M2I2]
MHDAARDLGRPSRLIAGSAGAAVALVGVAALLMSLRGDPPDGFFAVPAAALVPAGIALSLGALPVVGRNAGRVVHGSATALFVLAAAVCVAAFRRQIAASAVTLVALAALVLLARTIRGLNQAGARLADGRAAAHAEAAALRTANTDALTETAEVRSANSAALAEAAHLRSENSAALTEAAHLRSENSAALTEVAHLRSENSAALAEAARLREAHGKLETALTFKNDLTSMLTHDVAQPISSIASLAELLHADWADLPDDLRLELATKIDKNTQRLIKMMNDLQLLFRLDTGSVTARRNPVPLKEIAEAVACAPEDVRIEIGDDLSVLADRGHVRVVLKNLVDNALAYGMTPVIVSAARHDEQIEVAVQDNGPGIAEELLPTLFGRFVRGAGLGLFIVRHLVEANGGTVRYEHAVPTGARLVVTLEAAPV